MKKNLPKYMTKGGPGDDSKPGDVNTSAWWSTNKPDSLTNPSSIASMTKNKEIWWCTNPYMQVYSEIDGHWAACCFGKRSEEHTIENTSIKEWFVDSDYMNNIRREMLDPNSNFEYVDKYCRRCRSDEELYGKSRRTACLKIHSNDPRLWSGLERSAEMYKATGEFEFEEQVLEIQLKIYGSECNLDCHMCMIDNSTTRLKGAKSGVWNDHLFGKMSTERADYVKKVLKDKTKGVVEQVLELAPYIRSIKIIGGEPLIMKKHYELLDALIEAGHSHHIRVKYQTNLTQTKKGKHNIFDYIPKFENMTFIASVDGIGKSIEYTRRRTNWNELLFNIDAINAYDNAIVDFNGLVDFLTVLRFYEVIEWCLDHPGVIDQLNWAMIDKPAFLRVNNLPKELKENLIPKYEGWPDIQSALRMDEDPGFDIQQVFDYLLKQDKYYKGTKWEMDLFDVFPELEKYYISKEHDLIPLVELDDATHHARKAKREAARYSP